MVYLSENALYNILILCCFISPWILENALQMAWKYIVFFCCIFPVGAYPQNPIGLFYVTNVGRYESMSAIYVSPHHLPKLHLQLLCVRSPVCRQGSGKGGNSLWVLQAAPFRWIINKSLGLGDLIPCDIPTGRRRKREQRERKTCPVLNLQVN